MFKFTSWLLNFLHSTPFWFHCIILYFLFVQIGFMLRALVSGQRATDSLFCSLYLNAILIFILFVIYKLFVV